MSFFYLTPVKGDMPVHLLETIVSKRLEFLKMIFRGDSAVYNEFVIEGSIYDNVGHFMLCVVIILAENTGVSQFFLRAETELFKRRINSLTAYDIRCFAKKLLRSIKKYELKPTFIEPLQVLCQHLMLKDTAQHIVSQSHYNRCNIHNISLNFKYCLTLIGKRQVELQNGVAVLPCGLWIQYLIHLFSVNLKNRIVKTNLVMLKSDPRIMELLAKLRNDLPLSNTNTNILLSREIDSTSEYFPPCMLNLHQSLRKSHRLSHAQRFHYSLFLKDIGLPVEQAIDFWRAEYRQQPNQHSCCHNWEKDEKKFLYGIRHMYGLEGGRKNYTSVSCQRIQNDNSYAEGGCPFKSFDPQKMVKLLNSNCTDTIMPQINELKKRHQYTSACSLYLQKSLNNNCDNFSFNFTPVKFYMAASNSKSKI